MSLITGFLGSGKTTLLNHLLAAEGLARTAVLINEFGEVGIDQHIVRRIDPAAVLLKSGCICCTVQGELVDGLRELYMKRAAGALPPFERVIIETTGLADPLPIISCLMRDPLFKHAYRLGTLLTTVDAVHGEGQLDRHAEAVRQVAVADRLLVTKPDLAALAALERLAARLAALNPNARIVVALHGEVDPAQLFDGAAFDARSRPTDVRRWLREEQAAHRHDDPAHAGVNVNRHDDHIVSHCVRLDEPVSLEAFQRWYDEFAERRADHLLRMKGLLNVRGEARPFVVHGVQALQHLPAQLPAWPDADRRSRIVFITSDLPGREIEASLRGYLAQWKEEGRGAERRGPARAIWLNEAELTRMFSALAREADHTAASALRLMLLTGTSSEEARNARWEDFDLERREWRKAAGRAGARRIALGDAAMLLIRGMRGIDAAPAGQLFAGIDGESGRGRVAQAWRSAARLAGIEAESLEALRPVLAAGLFRSLPEALTRRLLGLEMPRRLE